MKKLRNSLLVSLCLLVLSSQLYSQTASAAKQGISLDRLEHYANFIQSEIDKGAISGAVSMVSRNGEIVYENAQGYSDLDKKTAMNMDNLFFIQSMTKPIITTAFMMLYEEGHFQLTDPVHMYIPGFKDLKVAKDIEAGKAGGTIDLEQDITIAHLLSHTAGLSHGLGASQLDKEYAFTMYFKPHPDIKDRVDSMLTLPLMSQPGEKWYYSAAPDVLSVLIEQFSGMSTRDFLKKRIFEPLEMNDTDYNLSEAQQKRVAMLHNANPQGKLMVTPADRQPPTSGNTIWSGVNALFSSAADYMKFAQMLLNEGEANGHRLLSRKTVELMTQNHTGDLFTDAGTGFGLGFAVVTDVSDTQKPGSEGIFYWSGAYNTHFFIDPVEELIAIFMTQKAPYSNFYHNKMRQMVLQAIVD